MKLAVIGKIIALSPIAGADRIEAATVVCGDAGKWAGVVNKGMAVGQAVLVFLQDAVLPPDPRWAFMGRHNWRVRMARFKGVPSECVILPTDSAHPVGTDMAAEFGVTKHQKPVPVAMAGEMAGSFPGFLPKTDEPNFQTVDYAALMTSGPWYVTEKADGTSCTAWVDEAGLHVCSRNWELREFAGDKAQNAGASNLYWQAARKYKLESLPVGTAVQFEIVGPGVQGNPMGLKEIEGRLFGAFKRDEQGRWNRLSVQQFPVVMPQARPLDARSFDALDADDLRKLAEIKYPNGAHAEGIVIRAIDQLWSFKVINLAYKERA